MTIELRKRICNRLPLTRAGFLLSVEAPEQFLLACGSATRKLKCGSVSLARSVELNRHYPQDPCEERSYVTLLFMRREGLWQCPNCKRPFANINQSHFCSRITLREHLAGKTPLGVTLFREFAKLVKRCGPVRVIPEKTRIAFQVRMSFAAVSLRRDRIVGHVVLARRLENPRFTKVETISPRNHVHSFCFTSCAQMDNEVLSWLREAYRVGQQKHLPSAPPTVSNE